MGWVEKPVRILEIRHAGDHGHEIYFREYNETIYNDELGSAEPTQNYTEFLNPFAPPPDPKDLIVVESSYVQKSGEVVPEIRIMFNPGYCFNYAYSLIQLSEDGGETWLDKAQTLEGKTFISGIRTDYNYLVKVKTISQQGVPSDGVISSISIEGKNQPPSDVPKLVVNQKKGILTATVTKVDDPDVEKYELRIGPSYENSEEVIDNFEAPTSKEFPTPQKGTLTFWTKAVDRMGLKSLNATKCVIDVFDVVPKNVIFSRTEDLRTWTPQNMYLDPWDRWHIDTKEKLGDFDPFFSMFDNPTLCFEDSPRLVLPIVDLGDKVLEPGCYYYDPWDVLRLETIQKLGDFEPFFSMFDNPTITLVQPKFSINTFLGVTVDFNYSVNTAIDTDYRTRVDGDQWSAWTSAQIKEFTGRRIEARLSPKSLDGTTDVIIGGATLEVDVPDVVEPIKNVTVPVEGLDYAYKQRFWGIPDPWVFTVDNNGVSVTAQITSRTEEGFRIQLFDINNQPVTGKIVYGEVVHY